MNAFNWRGPSSWEKEPETALRKPGATFGRPRLYDDEERKQRHREAALAAYHKSGKTTRASRRATATGSGATPEMVWRKTKPTNSAN